MNMNDITVEGLAESMRRGQLKLREMRARSKMFAPEDYMLNPELYVKEQAESIIHLAMHEILVQKLRQLQLLYVSCKAMLDCSGGVTTEQLSAYAALESATVAYEDPTQIGRVEDYLRKLQLEGKL